MSYFCIFLNQVKSHSKLPLVRVARTLVSIILHLSTNNNSGTLLILPGRQKVGVGRGLVILWKRGLASPFLSTDLMGWSWRMRERQWHMALGFSHEYWVEPRRDAFSTLIFLQCLFAFFFFLTFSFVLRCNLLMDNVVIVSGGQRKDSAIPTHVSILPQGASQVSQQ